jgi:Membrane protein involved in the export of O-antigen and teichoic acid
MKTTSFYKGISWLLILNLLIKPIWIFAIDRKVQILIGNAAYGEYFSINNFCLLLYVFADAGISNMLNQKLSFYKEYDLKKLWAAKIILTAFFIIISIFIGWLNHLNIEILLYVVFIQTLTSFLVFTRSIITAHQLFMTDAMISIIDKSLMILFCGILIYSFAHTIDIFLFLKIQLLCTGSAFIVSLFFAINKNYNHSYVQINLKSVLVQLLPFALILFLMSLHYRLDGFLLLKLFHGNGAEESGIYARGYRLLDAGNMIGYLFASFLLPFIARHHNNAVLIKRTVSVIGQSILIAASSAVLFFLVFGSWIDLHFYNSENNYEIEILQLCMAALPAYYMVHIYSSVLTAKGDYWKLIHVLIVCVLINLLANLLLIPEYGALGSCLSALLSQYVCGFWLLIKVRLANSTEYRMRLIQPGLFIILLLALYLSGKKLAIDGWIILGIGGIVTLLFILFRILSWRKNLVSLS